MGVGAVKTDMPVVIAKRCANSAKKLSLKRKKARNSSLVVKICKEQKLPVAILRTAG